MSNELQVEQFKHFKQEITRFLMMYKFALNELETKVDILQEEFQLLHDYNPIEHLKTRLKSPESILKKLYRKGGGMTLGSIREHVKDIAGMRITCSFLSDIYTVRDMLCSRSDLNIIEMKDYIREPKPNGYQSLHLLAEIPVYMSDREERVLAEIQIRTIAMDFWASLEHKIFYKYNQSVPPRLLQELKEAADAASSLDLQMERLHHEISAIKEEKTQEEASNEMTSLVINNQKFPIPAALLKMLE